MKHNNERQLMHIRLDKEKYDWIAVQAKMNGISKNDVVQMLVKKAMDERKDTG